MIKAQRQSLIALRLTEMSQGQNSLYIYIHIYIWDYIWDPYECAILACIEGVSTIAHMDAVSMWTCSHCRNTTHECREQGLSLGMHDLLGFGFLSKFCIVASQGFFWFHSGQCECAN